MTNDNQRIENVVVVASPGNADLHTAVTTTGWPTLAQSRGKFLFFLDNEDLRDAYLAGHPSLEGRVPPPAGSPNYIVHADDDEIEGSAPDPTQDFYKVWAFHADWTDPSQSTFTGPISLRIRSATETHSLGSVTSR